MSAEHLFLDPAGFDCCGINDTLDVRIDNNDAALSIELPPIYAPEYDVYVATSPTSSIVSSSSSLQAACGIQWHDREDCGERNGSTILPLYDVGDMTAYAPLTTTHAPFYDPTSVPTGPHHVEHGGSKNCKLTDQKQQAGYQRGTDKETRQGFLERNRVAARKCREKKKRYEDGIRKTYSDKERENAGLKSTVANLQSEVIQLKDKLLEHAKCGDPIINHGINYLANRTLFPGGSDHRDNVEAQRQSGL